MLADIALAVLEVLLLLLMLLMLVTKLLLMLLMLLLLLQVELVLVVDQVQVVRVEGLDGRRLHSEGVGRGGGGGGAHDAHAEVVVDLHRSLGQGDRQRILHVARMVMMSFISLILPKSLQHTGWCKRITSCLNLPPSSYPLT